MKNKMTDILAKSEDELTSSLSGAREELFKLKMGRVTNQLTNVMQIRQKRREIARLMTAITARSSKGKKE
jgi:large subunit ribosomal protein L29